MPVGVTQYQHRVRFLGEQNLFSFDQNTAEHGAEAACVYTKKVIRLANV